MYMNSAASFGIVLKQNKYIKLFNDLGAIDAGHSIYMKDSGIMGHHVFDRMVNRGVFIECEVGKFYMDVDAARRFRDLRHKRAIIGLLVALAIAFILKDVFHM